MPALGRVSDSTGGMLVVEASDLLRVEKVGKSSRTPKLRRSEKALDTVYTSIRKHFWHKNGSKSEQAPAERQASDTSLLSQGAEGQVQMVELTTEAEIGFSPFSPKHGRREKKGTEGNKLSPLSDHTTVAMDDMTKHITRSKSTRSLKVQAPLHERIGSLSHQLSLSALIHGAGRISRGRTLLEGTIDIFLRPGVRRKLEQQQSTQQSMVFPSSQQVARNHTNSKEALRATNTQLTLRLARRNQVKLIRSLPAISMPNTNDVPIGRAGVWAVSPGGRKRALGSRAKSPSGGGPSPLAVKSLKLLGM
eukprot:comp12621_c0_seq1/m.7659 comp12621_c0_seq1/g.7659  ORF comp12621_c0_seq1/g.7659 comp12621_c0_seq1/m.7659 type:complete len:306 (-) comp12621_c0_seq1:594-1511(-)